MPHLQRIQKKSPDEFSRKQAELLEDFLGHLIKLQREHRAVALSFSGHLEQLRKESDAVDCCDPVLYHMRQQSRLLGGLFFVSRESTWLLRKLENSCLASPSFIVESHKILEITVGFMSKYKDIKGELGQLSVRGVPGGVRDGLMQFVQHILDDFGSRIKGLQAEGVGKGSVIENLLDCLGYACKSPYERYPSKPGYGYGEADISPASEFIKAVTETSGLIKEAREKLNSDKVYTLPGGTSLGNIVLWRILFESSLADLRFDHIRRMQAEAVKLGAKLLRSKTTLSDSVEEHLNRVRGEISLLLSDGDRVLLDYVAMHRTVAEITYMLGDVFTTGGAGMNDLSDEAGIKVDSDLEFPWDKHNVPDFIKCW
ncbi:hypothetical protein MKW94_017163 [Papaver nudicaule]|uniref:Uncharacterized protein n=1 Tax=Papaver nudicaule TaxID=74823 RepID=A0AA41SE77_PAPNU|nr:hypothetical protein [Papaver nudicaule]